MISRKLIPALAGFAFLSGCGGGGDLMDCLLDGDCYVVGGALTGLLSGSVVLQNNGEDNLTLSQNGSYTFGKPLDIGDDYQVTVLNQPVGQTCTINDNGPNNVNVSCTPDNHTVGGVVTGLPAGASVTLQNNGGDTLVIAANQVFTFATSVPYQKSYSVTVTSVGAPATQCTVANATGSIQAANITNVTVACQ